LKEKSIERHLLIRFRYQKRPGSPEPNVNLAAVPNVKAEPLKKDPMLPVNTLLCPTDFSEPSREAVKIAVELAAHFGAQLWLVNVVPILPVLPRDQGFSFPVPEYEGMLQTHAGEELRRLADQVTKGVSVRTILGRGDAAGEIVRIARQQKADMIVIATHGVTGWRRVVFGSVAEKVVRLATTPVLTTRAPEPETLDVA
jgi:nucleotide-binding universal stress UspA family protein